MEVTSVHIVRHCRYARHWLLHIFDYSKSLLMVGSSCYIFLLLSCINMIKDVY